jgi:nitrate/nitrite transporter NarK
MTWKMAFALVSGLTAGYMFLNIPPALDALMVLYGASYVKISLLMSALLWSHTLMQVPGGMIADRIGIVRTLSIGLLFMGFGSLTAASSPNLAVAILGRVVIGFGTGLSFVTTMKLIALYAPEGGAGSYQAFFAASFSIGCILAFLTIPQVIGFGWQWVYLTPGLTCFPLLGMLLALKVKQRSTAGPAPLTLPGVVRIKVGWILGIYHALSYGSMINLGNWLPSLLAEVWTDTTAIQLAWGGALVMAISGLGRLCGGFILFRISPLRIANGSIAILCLMFVGLFLIPVPLFLLLLALLAAWFASINFGAFFLLASRATSPDSLATLFGFINFLANLGAVLFTLMFGFVKDAAGSLSAGFGILALLCAGAFLLGGATLGKTLAKSKIPVANRSI